MTGSIPILNWLSNFEASDWIAIVAALVAAGSLLVSVWTAVGQRRTEHDRELLGQLILTLERSYASLRMPGSTDNPNRDRLGWLTAARHLLGYKELKKDLKTKLYRTLCNEHEEYWRHQFYVILGKIDSDAFFSCADAKAMTKENIEPTSAALVLAFSAWPTDRKDPLDEVSFEAIVKENNLFSTQFRHFRSYVSKGFQSLYEKSRYDS